MQQHKLEVWPGYSTTAEVYEGGLLLQVDQAHRVLRAETAKDVMSNLAKKVLFRFLF